MKETINICSARDCARQSHARGMCNKHYERFRKRGGITKYLNSKTPAEAFEKMHTPARKQDCWVWTGSSTPAGYGRFRVDGRMTGANRYAYEKANGPIPEGMFVLHKCDNPACVNPYHLFLGDHKSNMKDMTRKKRQAFGKLHARAKLSRKDILAIRADSRFQIDIAAQYGICQAHVSKIKLRKVWDHVR